MERRDGVTPGVLIIAGPTAGGKTDLAIALAERFGAEIIGADSRQIYAGMPIGTAAPTPRQLARVPHHLIGFLDPDEQYSAARFVRDARLAIDDIGRRGRRVIVAGGTGFYLRALCGGVDLHDAYDLAVRERLAREAHIHPPGVMADWLRALAPERAAALPSNDPYRVLRALEIALSPSALTRGETLPTLRATGTPFVTCWVEIEPQVLAERIEARTDAMLALGLLEEAERIGTGVVAANAVGYRESLAFLDGLSTRAELRTQLIRNTRRYAKRQATWFRAEPGIVRVRPDAVETTARERLGWA